MKKITLFICSIGLACSTLTQAANNQTTDRDDCQSAAWYSLAAERGDATAQYKLGMMYFNGDEVKTDYKKAFALLNSAAAQNNAQAQYHLATAYEMGIGTQANS